MSLSAWYRLDEHRLLLRARMGVPRWFPARPASAAMDAEVLWVHRAYPHLPHSDMEAQARVLARLDALAWQRIKAAAKTWGKRIAVGLALLVLLSLLTHRAHGQQTTIRGTAKGATSANSATVSSTSADHNALDVNVVAGGASGSNAAAGPTGSAVPADASYTGFNLSGNLVGASAANPFPTYCVSGCGGASAFLDNAGFTAGTTPINITGGWYSTSPSNCTSGSACSPQLTLDRKLFVQDFQGTSPWVVSANGGSFAVTGTFWQGTQPVSIATMPSTPVTGTFWQTTQPVSGTFWQSTQPVSIASMPSTPVTGTFWQATQPVSGTFWQTTQPVSWSGQTVTATQATGTNLHVVCDSGCSSSAGFADNTAFTVGTTPINVLGGYYTTGAAPALSSGNAARARIDANSYLDVDCVTGCAGGASTPADAFANPTTAGLSMDFPMLWNGSSWDRLYGDKTNGAFVNVKTSVLPTGAALDASLTTLDTDVKANITLHAGTNVIGHVIADSGSTTAVTGNVTAIQATGSNLHVAVDSAPSTAVTNAGTFAVQDAPPTLTKGTQGSTGFSVQALKDAGRTYITLSAQLITGVTSEALATFTKNVNGTNTTGQTAYTITSGKTFRIQSLYVAISNSTTVANNCIYNVRVGGSVAASSPIVLSTAATAPVAVATSKGFFALGVPDGIDIPGNGTIQIGVSHLENVTTASISSFTLTGYEY